ncbi:MAG TPA: putative sulfate exporter family transporter, partial [Bacteroidales bacterium]|nr:putative sulfate exporter family transporter [Bacteroidales bacterium]
MKHNKLTEDWTAVIIGLSLIILNVTTTFIPEIPKFGPREGWSGWTVLSTQVFTTGNTLRLVMTILYFLLFAVIGSVLMRKNILMVLVAFPVIFLISIGAQFIASAGLMRDLGLETVLFSLLIGLFISNVLKTPAWLKEGIQSEFYIKVGLVMLGSTILFSEIMRAGFNGLIQAVVVVMTVWYLAFWIAKKLKVDEEMGVILASAVSICGVSAAIATAGAIKGEGKKLSYVISLVLLVAIPMMIFMPLLARWMQLTPEVTGAWLGGSIDTTAAVAAAGTISGETALQIATIV